MKYILLSYDAVKEFASGRFYQSEEYKDGKDLCAILRNETNEWNHSRVHALYNDNGLIFYTDNVDKHRGILFDLDTFSGFNNTDDKVVPVFQKVLKYAVRYFENYPLVSCERAIAHTKVTIVYPYPFSATRNVDKIYIDRNSSKIDRKGKDFLTVYYYGDDDRQTVSHTNLRKALPELDALRLEKNNVAQPHNNEASPLVVTDFTNLNIPIDSHIGYENWDYYLTENQKIFIDRDCLGAERLEGAAGTGKTLSMVLRCIRVLKQHIECNIEFHIIFITHSIATKERIESIFTSNWNEFHDYQEKNNNKPFVSVCITTLQEWSANNLGTNSIEDDQYLDKDASYSKELQMLYIQDAYEEINNEYWSAYEMVCSKEFIEFKNKVSLDNMISILQMEIAIILKGHKIYDLDDYKELQRPTYSMPLINDADKNFVFNIYTRYQQALTNVDQYDSDDIVMTALGNIETPIWNRKRAKLGYDECFVDETHLFNINELSLLHFINKPNYKNHIIFAIDKSQAIGDWGITDSVINDKLGLLREAPLESHRFKTVFRSSPSVVNLAFNVLTSGSAVFTNFDNPLDYSSYNLTAEEERKCQDPSYTLCINDDEMIEKAIAKADEYSRELSLARSSILLVVSTASLLNELDRKLKDGHKQYVVIQGRNDNRAIRDAVDNNKYVLGHIDYIGGLEFDCVIMVGIDEGRVPPSKKESPDHFINYAWYNRLYVAITRAKYIVHIFADRNRGLSSLLESSLSIGLLQEHNKVN